MDKIVSGLLLSPYTVLQQFPKRPGALTHPFSLHAPRHAAHATPQDHGQSILASCETYFTVFWSFEHTCTKAVPQRHTGHVKSTADTVLKNTILNSVGKSHCTAWPGGHISPDSCGSRELELGSPRIAIVDQGSQDFSLGCSV